MLHIKHAQMPIMLFILNKSNVFQKNLLSIEQNLTVLKVEIWLL